VTNEKSPEGGDLLDQLAQLLRQVVSDTIKRLHIPRVIWATVQSVDSTTPPTLTVVKSASMGEPQTLVRYLASYSPTVGDSVIGFSVGLDYWVLGKLA
jgi:exosome complex RNA-binding protein Rrp4